MTIYHYLGYYIGSLIVLVRKPKGDVASATRSDRHRFPNDPSTFLEDLQQAGVSYD